MQKTRFLNKEEVIKRLTDLAIKVKAKNKNIEKIILFGSLVNNTYTLRSDADLIVVLKKSNDRFMDRIPQLLYAFIDAPVSIDIFPYTKDEIGAIPFARKAIAKGIVVC